MESNADDRKVPQKEFMLMMLIMLRKAEKQTGVPLVCWLESFEEENKDWNPDLTVDSYDDKSLRLAIHKYMDMCYPPDVKK